MYKRVNELLGTGYKSDSDIDWSKLSIVYKFSEDFIKEFQDYVDWWYVSLYQSLSESFIREFQDKVDWKGISENQILSWNFILEFKDKVDWYNISRFQPFIDSTYKKVNKEVLIRNKLYHLYQKTKKNGWFIGYINKRKNIIPKLIQFELNSSITLGFIIKSKIYWKDLVMRKKVKYFEPIRQVKYVQKSK